MSTLSAIERVKQMSTAEPDASAKPVEASAAPQQSVPDGMPAVEDDDPAPAVEDAPASPVEEAEEKPAESQPSGQQPKPSKKEILATKTPMEKAEFAFKKQLQRTKEKYEQKMAALEKEMSELKKGKPEEQQKGRDAFQTDEQYMDYLVDRRLSSRQSSGRVQELEAERKNIAAQEQFERAAALYRKNIDDVIPEAERGDFLKEVTEARDNGFEEVLKKVPDVMDFVTTNKLGPLVLREFIKNKDAFTRVVYAGSVMDRALELRALGKELYANVQAGGQPAAGSLPVIGKPGSRASSAKATQGPESSGQAMLDFIRHNHRRH